MSLGPHLTPAQLEPEAELAPHELEHLAACPRCRVEQRLLAGFFDEPPPLDPTVRTVLDATRSHLTRTLAEPDDGGFSWPEPDERYAIEGRLGAGGMGEVLAVQDRVLSRRVAMKVAAPELQAGRGLARFVEEAQVGAFLQHPGIVPVHELGHLPDGRAFFTMKEVDGVTLSEAIARVHAASEDRWQAAGPFTLRRLVDAVRRVAETVGYAHDRGVCHRDLKPANVMLGAWGEVLVVDWGLAKVRAGEVASVRSDDDALKTRLGAVAGTPAWMAPEQARSVTEAGPPADVYALGAMLRCVLTGRPPYRGLGSSEILEALRAGPPPPLSEATSPGPLPADLVDLCEQAMDRDPLARPDAGAFAATIEAWLDGSARRERALQTLAEAEALLPEARAARARADALDDEARHLLEATRSFDPEERKQDGWAAEDAARALRAEAELLELRFTEGVRSALVHDPDLPEAHRALAAWHRDAQAAAEAAGDALAASQHELLLRQHDDGTHADWLRGVGRVSMPGRGSVRVLRCVEEGRRQVLRLHDERPLPLEAAELPVGSWVLEVEGRRAPLTLGRQEHVALPAMPALVLGPGEALVPAGWFRSGGDPLAPGALPGRRVWLDSFVLRADPVTHAEYLEFLNALVAANREDEALRHAPRERSAEAGVAGALLVARDDDGRFILRPDAEGDAWEPDWPAWMVDWSGARAYAAWRAVEDGLPWRLPWELEWEKAARGVDGRAWPWGDFADPTWACVHGSRAGRPMPAPVGAHPVDTSVYGVRGTAGNVCDWVLDLFEEDGPPLVDGRFDASQPVAPADERSRCVKGGSWSNPTLHGRGAFRDGRHPADRRWVIGFRLARSV